MNTALKLREFAEKARRVLLTGPAGADGDSIGATLALARGIRALGVGEVLVAANTPERYRWMQDAKGIVANAHLKGDFDLVIVMDGDRHRLAPKVLQAFQAARYKVVVDHHRTTSSDGYDLAIVDPTAPATCSQVLEILDAWSVPLDLAIAEQLYVGLIYDTGGFRYSNTRPDTHRAAARLLATGIDHASITNRVLMEIRPAGLALKAAVLSSAQFFSQGQLIIGICSMEAMALCGANTGDLDGIVESLLYVQGAEMCVLIVERDASTVKLSLRAKGHVNVSALAKRLDSGGGGHAKAAGVVLRQSLKEALDTLPAICAATIAADLEAQAG
jgi:bifunctional oligoribonuclease and PAP phosphatase NrnA